MEPAQILGLLAFIALHYQSPQSAAFPGIQHFLARDLQIFAIMPGRRMDRQASTK